MALNSFKFDHRQAAELAKCLRPPSLLAPKWDAEAGDEGEIQMRAVKAISGAIAVAFEIIVVAPIGIAIVNVAGFNPVWDG